MAVRSGMRRVEEDSRKNGSGTFAARWDGMKTIDLLARADAEFLAMILATILDAKKVSGGRAATKDEKTARVELIDAMFEAEIDTVSAGSYTFTIEPTTVDLDGIEGEMMPDRLHVHRASNNAGKTAPRASKKAPARKSSPCSAKMGSHLAKVLESWRRVESASIH